MDQFSQQQEIDPIDQLFNQVVARAPYQELVKAEAAPSLEAQGVTPKRDLISEAIISFGPAILGGLSGESGAIAQAPAGRQARDLFETRRKEEGAQIAREREAQQKRVEAMIKAKQAEKDSEFKQAALSAKDRDFGLKEQELELKKQGLGIDRMKAKADIAKSSGSGGMTEGLKALDKDYAKDYNDWTSAGRPTVDKNLKRLRDAKELLANDKTLTGSVRGYLPDFVRSTTNENAIKTRDDVRAAAQGALKATLGAQFTEKEGERIMNQSYNEQLSPEANIERINAAINELEVQRNLNDAKAKYFQENRTLRGFDATTGWNGGAPQTKTINGVTYVKVEGGWQAQ